MKNNIIMFLLGVFVTISVAATGITGDLITMKPAKPVSVVMDWFYLTSSADSFIQKYSSQGYQVDFIEQVDKDRFVVVMEKY